MINTDKYRAKIKNFVKERKRGGRDMKYIIEFQDEAEYEVPEEGLSYHKCVDVSWWSASDRFIRKLKPYAEGEEYQRGFDDAHKTSVEECQRSYERGVTEAWDFARHLNAVTPDVTDAIYLSPFGGKGIDVALEMSYTSAKRIYDEYYQEKRERDFCVGAEVEDKDGQIAYVLNTDHEGYLVLSMEKYACPQLQRKENWKCTGYISEFVRKTFENED